MRAMMERKRPDRQLPQCSFAALLHFLDSQHGKCPLARVDVALFGRGHRRVAASVIGSLALLDLIDCDGAPSGDLSDMIAAPGTRKLHLGNALRRAYPTLHDLPDDGYSIEHFEENVRSRIEAAHGRRAAIFAIDTNRYLTSTDSAVRT